MMTMMVFSNCCKICNSGLKSKSSLKVDPKLKDGLDWIVASIKIITGPYFLQVLTYTSASGSHFFQLNTFYLFQLVIEARIGQPGYSDIAIDDVYIDDGLCRE